MRDVCQSLPRISVIKMRRPLQTLTLVCLLALPWSQAFAEICPSPSAIAIPEDLERARIVIFGEIHGTKEAPEFVGQYLCALLRVRPRVVLGLEIPKEEQARISAFMSSEGTAESRKLLLEGRHWQSETPDGRSSVAMFELIELARQLRAAGSGVSVLAFDEWAKEKPRDVAMGENIRESLHAAPESAHVILVGNLHAKNVKTDRPTKRDGEHMAFTIRDLKPVSLNIDYSSGTVWTCRVFRKCGEEKAIGTPSLLPRAVGINPRRPLLVDGFDGEYYVGAISASSPVVRVVPVVAGAVVDAP